MNRKMTLLALAGKCAARGASGLAVFSAAKACFAKKPSWSSSEVSARPAKPAPICHRNSRRWPEQEQDFRFWILDFGLGIFCSINIHKFVQIQNHLTQLGDGAIILVVPPLEETQSDVDLAVGRLATESVLIESLDSCIRIAAGRGFDTTSE